MYVGRDGHMPTILPHTHRVEPGELPTLQQLGLSAPPRPAPRAPGTGPTPTELRGGETEALRHLHAFIAEVGDIHYYIFIFIFLFRHGARDTVWRRCVTGMPSSRRWVLVEGFSKGDLAFMAEVGPGLGV